MPIWAVNRTFASPLDITTRHVNVWVVVNSDSAAELGRCEFTGPELGQQWFDRFLVAFPDDTPIVKAAWNQTWSRRIFFQTSSPKSETVLREVS